MSLVSFLHEEFRTWRHAWSQIESFLDRIDGSRDSDERHRKRVTAMLLVVNAFNEEALLRRGAGLFPLFPPLEMAIEKGSTDILELLDGGHPYDDPQPFVKARLPGAYELEMTVGPIFIKPDDTEPEVNRVDFVINLAPLFERYDESKKQWEQVTVPKYDFGLWAWPFKPDDEDYRPHVDLSLFDEEGREKLAKGLRADDAHKLLKWSELAQKRADELAGPINLFWSDSLLANADDPMRYFLIADACLSGSAAITRALDLLKGDDLGDFAAKGVKKKGFLDDLRAERDAMKARAEYYFAVATGKRPVNEAYLQGLLDFGSKPLGLSLFYIPDLPAPLSTLSWTAIDILDAAVDARVSYPGGTMRILRTMEWSLNRLWPTQKLWFDLRRPILSSVLKSTFIDTFLRNLYLLYKGEATELPFTADLAQPAFINGIHLYVHLGGDVDLDDLEPGTVAVLDGDRKTLAVLLAEDPPPPDPSPPPPTPAQKPKDPPVPDVDKKKPFRRIRVMPLRVSTDAKDPNSTAGIVSAKAPAVARITAGPIELTNDEIKRGARRGRPQDDGLVQQLVALWSQLSLLLGSHTVNVALSSARPGVAHNLPTFLAWDAKIPISGEFPVEANAARLIVRVEAVKNAGIDLDAKSQPVIARAGELLLLRGDDAHGSTWQTAIEVLSMTRTTLDQVDDPTIMNPPGMPICCHGAGEVVVIQFAGQVPVRLEKNMILHRHFRGFGAASLAAGAILPEVVDPDSWKDDKHVYRGPELKAARELLDRWLWRK